MQFYVYISFRIVQLNIHKAMSCIICFLEDHFQEKIRILSQSKSDRFEEVLIHYQNNFINEFINLVDVNQCDIHMVIHEKTKAEGNFIHDKIKSTFNLKLFFNEIRKIYITWIKGSYSRASNLLNDLLKTYELLQITNKLNNNIFFRGRRSTSILSKKDLFHIPFNKRFLIQNQRYSITGQPLLYLGLSPLDVVAELRCNIEQIENIHFCSYLHNSDTILSVFDITNPFPDLFSNHNILTTDIGDAPSIADQINIESDVYKFILSQICSFKRSRWSETNVFSEEYILPQLLTEVLNQIEFNGILFSSTRVEYNKITSNRPFHINKYRENLALFTTYNEYEDYDKNLYEQFIISKPITNDDLTEITINDLEALRKKIFKGEFKENWHKLGPVDLTQITGITTQTLFSDLIIKTNYGDIKYFDHIVGRIHLQLLYQILLDVRNRLYNQI